ncbi:MAG TPA: hypothetical protein VF846_12990 [Thermoanaerobaculia bacterium]
MTDEHGLVGISPPVTLTVQEPCVPVFAGLQSVEATESALRLTWNEATATCTDQPLVYNVYRSADPSFMPSWDSLWFCSEPAGH